MAAVKWAIDNKRTQQGFTALEETVKTFLCNHYELDETKEITRDKICKSICTELNIHKRSKREKNLNDEIRKLARDTWIDKNFKNILEKLGEKVDSEMLKNKINLMFEEIPDEMVEFCEEISRCRNSMNHFGYSNPGNFTANKLNSNLKTYFAEFKEVIELMQKEKNNDDNRAE